MPFYEQNDLNMHYTAHGLEPNADTPTVVWTHGWGRSGADFLPMIDTLQKSAHHITIDFLGFGQSSPPPADWGTAEYADFMATFICETFNTPVIWVGHSFGCRVGLQMGANHSDIIKGLFLIAGAGLKKTRSPLQRLKFKTRIYTYKFLKKCVPLKLVSEGWLKSKFGSRDYKSAGNLRGLFVNVVNEDLTEQARATTIPTILMYGEHDTETPPEMGERLSQYIKSAELNILPNQDHYTVLSSGRHPVVARLKRFIVESS